LCAGLEALNGLALDVAGLNQRASTITICSTCSNALAHRRRPHLALANGLEIGSVPPELANLTWAEQRLIALYRVTIDLVYFYNDDRPGDMERKTFHSLPRVLGKDSAGNWKGRCFCMPQDSFSVNDVLPPDPEELTSTFRVIFLGAKLPEPKDIDLQYALTVDRKKVKAALEWLVGNNELYKRRFDRKQLRISQANLAKFPDKPSVPQVVRDDAILRSVDSSKLTADMSSYTRPDSVDAPPADAAGTDAHGSRWQHTGLADVNASGVGPDAIERAVNGRERAAPAEPLPAIFSQTDGGVLQMPSAQSVFMLDKGQPDVDHGAFPVLFPFGVGGPNQTGRVRISGQKYIAHLMKYHDRRFATHAPFVFTMFNVLQRQRVCSGAKRHLDAGYFMDFSKELPKLSSTAIAEVIKELRDRQDRNLLVNLRSCQTTANKQTAKAIARLFSQMSTIGGGNLPRTAASKRRARYEALAMYVKLGLPDFFVTITPDDHHAPLVIHFNGKHVVKLKLSDSDLPVGLPSASERLRIWCNDPLAAAQFASLVMDAFIAALLGFSSSKDKLKRKLGVMGDVKAFDFIDEEQNRGTLHWHGMVWLAHKPDYHAFVELMKTESFQKRVLEYLSSVIKNEPVALWNRAEIGSDLRLPAGIEICKRRCTLSECNGSEHDFVVGEATVQHTPSEADDNHISLRRVSDPLSPNFNRQAQRDWHYLVPACNTHLSTHTHTCWKGQKNEGKIGDERQCRMGFPHALCSHAHFDEHGDIHLRRRDHWVNNFNPFWLLALRCNHDLKSMWGTGTKIMAALMYCTNYMSKLNKKLLNTLMLVQVRVSLCVCVCVWCLFVCV
jgi:hypothetical protein